MTPEDILKLPYRPCVGIMLINRDGLIWSGRRIDNPSKDGQNAWQMPQGGIDKGEDPRDAALRELQEETSVPASEAEILAEMADWVPYDLPVEIVPKLWNGKYRGQMQKWFAMRFEGSDDLINIETEMPEFSHWAWMHSSDLINKIVPFKRHTYEQVFAEFAPFLED